MSKRKTTEQFIKEAIQIHGNKYNYEFVDYINTNIKIKIICLQHGIFEQIPKNHLKGFGCSKCSGNKKSNTNEFIEKAIKIHGDIYDYSLVKYENWKTKIDIICLQHGIFEQTPNNHLKGRGCPKCKGGVIYDRNIFIEKANKIHNNYYDYSLIEYINCKTKIKIICPQHGSFEQIPSDHMMGKGCPKCSTIRNSYKLTKTTEQFIKEAKQIHNNIYDYRLVNYLKSNIKVKIICSKHGIFEQTPNNHLTGKGCPKCNRSKGEIEIENILIKNNIKFEIQKRFKKCKYKRTLPFDFYLPKYNLCIEYDGKQHTESIDYFGGDDEFKLRQKRDDIKNRYCIDNGILLIRISHNDNISEKMKIINSVKCS